MKDARAKVIAWCPGLDLDFLDELLTPEEGKVTIDASRDAPTSVIVDTSQDDLGSAATNASKDALGSAATDTSEDPLASMP